MLCENEAADWNPSARSTVCWLLQLAAYFSPGAKPRSQSTSLVHCEARLGEAASQVGPQNRCFPATRLAVETQ